MSELYVFVGEKRSDTAIRRGWTWLDGHLAARTLHRALKNVGLDPQWHVYMNLFRDGDGYELVLFEVDMLRSLAGQGYTVVGMGRRVQAELERLGIEHRKLVHPAARGSIRASAEYDRHVAFVLGAPVALGGR